MAIKVYDFPDIGEVSVSKNSRSRSLRIKVSPSGKITATIPSYVPFIAAKTYISNNIPWIKNELSKRKTMLTDGLKIGRLHTLQFIEEPNRQSPTSRVTSNSVVIRHSGSPETKEVQNIALKACTRALKLQARHFLPKRLKDLALSHGYTYNDVTVKQLSSRWGSCNQNKDIVLNIFLMELPIELIDYVILHELAHTNHMHHGKDFWDEMDIHTNGQAKQLRRRMKKFQPTIPAQSVA
jgi:predicted metal-dependent hydrolase